MSFIDLLIYLHRSPGEVLETFNFLENAEDSDEDEDEEGDLMDDISTDKHHRNKKHKTKVFPARARSLKLFDIISSQFICVTSPRQLQFVFAIIWQDFM